MGWIGGVVAATTIAATANSKGRKRRNRKESKVAIVFSIILIVIGSLVPLVLIFLSDYNGGSFPILIIGIVFLIIFGSLILTFAVMETDYDEEKDREYSRSINRTDRRDHSNNVRKIEDLDERIYWGNPRSKINRERIDNYCSQCGSQVEYIDQFCSTCGRRI